MGERAVSFSVFEGFLRFLEVLLLLGWFHLEIQTFFLKWIIPIEFHIILFWLATILPQFFWIFVDEKFIISIKLSNIHGLFFLQLSIRSHIINIFEGWIHKINWHGCPLNEVRWIIHSLTYTRLVSGGMFINGQLHLYIYEFIHITNNYIWKEFLQATILKSLVILKLLWQNHPPNIFMDKIIFLKLFFNYSLHKLV